MSKIHKCILVWITLASLVELDPQNHVHNTPERSDIVNYTRKPAYMDREHWVKPSQQKIDTPRTHRKKKFKYILHWTSDLYIEPFQVQGMKAFTNCSTRNCVVTSNRDHFGTNKVQYFDAIIFSARDIWNEPSLTDMLPEIRYPHQKYVFFSIESSHNFPLCDEEYEYFFNLTWTYKLNSDMLFLYLLVRNSSGAIIGPKKDMHWMKIEDMEPIDDRIKQKLQSKTRAVAWVVSKCETNSKRESFVNQINDHLSGTGLQVDIYGKCFGYSECGRPDLMLPDCWELIEKDHHFYLAFENSMSEDYVTEKVLKPLQHYTVPIVYGAANYTRFMPDGIYLNALKLGPLKVAQEIIRNLNDKESYYNFFKWHNHYSYHCPSANPKTSPLCTFCKKLHGRFYHKTYYRFRDWWNIEGACPKKPDSTMPTILY